MKKILFICLGNICRSPMAEFMMNDLIEKSPLSGHFKAYSKATSYEEEGNPPHPGTMRKLREKGVKTYPHHSSKLCADDYGKYDYIIGMEDSNIRNIMRIIGSDPDCKVYKLLDFAGGGNIDDPWYTGDFDTTWQDISSGIEGLKNFLLKDIPQ